MSEQERIFRNMVRLFRLFHNSPNHLAKWMLDNLAFDDIFLKKILENDRLNSNQIEEKLIFLDIQEMTDYYNVFDESFTSKKRTKNSEDELNKKLENYIKLEKYEDAIRIRDYMIKLGYKKDENGK